jgi:hypothetical protein
MVAYCSQIPFLTDCLVPYRHFACRRPLFLATSDEAAHSIGRRVGEHRLGDNDGLYAGGDCGRRIREASCWRSCC